jgi:hypothetical protein
MNHKRLLYIVLILVIAPLVILVTGCASNSLAPLTSYQGRLTDEKGNPLNGTVDLTIKLYHSGTGGDAVHTETHTNVEVDQGLFDLIIGPTSLGSISPEDMT